MQIINCHNPFDAVWRKRHKSCIPFSARNTMIDKAPWQKTWKHPARSFGELTEKTVRLKISQIVSPVTPLRMTTLLLCFLNGQNCWMPFWNKEVFHWQLTDVTMKKLPAAARIPRFITLMMPGTPQIKKKRPVALSGNATKTEIAERDLGNCITKAPLHMQGLFLIPRKREISLQNQPTIKHRTHGMTPWTFRKFWRKRAFLTR